MPISSCAYLLANLSDYVDGSAAAETCAALDHHLAECAECRAMLDTFQKTVDLSHHIPAPALSESARQRLYSALQLGEFFTPR